MHVRFFWDFHGPNAAKTAAHFVTHLGEFLAKNDLALPIDQCQVSDGHWCASCDPPDLPAALTKSTPDEATIADRIGQALRPQRVELIEEI